MDTPAHQSAADRPRAEDGAARVVVGVDGAPSSRAALEQAFALAARRGAEVEVVATYPLPLPWFGAAPLFSGPDALHRATESGARAVLEEVRRSPAVSRLPGIERVTARLTVSEGPAAAVLIERSRGAGLLVVGRDGRRSGRAAMIGSVALHCVTGATCPVLVVHPEPPPRTSPPLVVVGVDGSPASAAALRGAAAEAGRLGAELEVVAAFERDGRWTALDAAAVSAFEGIRADIARGAARMVQDALAALPGGAARPAVRTSVVEGAPAEVLADRAARAVLLVLGSRGRGGVRGLLGSVALRCLSTARCPVLVLHGDQDADRVVRAASTPEPVSAGR
ncbi:universal stress protein [Blastococcus sp. MG754426]|uniref:universal stress protein n=1 Tax=unclassified Blastococcus TaxID=2619396 RepID=UPI001EF0AD5E|nr:MULTISPECIES: universal stress protein [unclassified Blastococcus]MCF6509661.1 universal stress protein [Blastococcus sp. MG754426]MCF6510724.1 universal stress protein [Blastococcus sp. MG754427]MCF6737171.1 universal stress protein [Blastococcus sp. KM273129]